VSKTRANGWHGIRRASVPAGAVCLWVCSSKRQPRPKLARLRGRRFKSPAPFISLLLGLLIAVNTCTLPLPLVFLFVDANSAAKTEGCKTKTCCTALCYLDKNGVHHCVHKHDESCGCDSLKDDSHANLILLSTIAILPFLGEMRPVFLPTGWIHQTKSLIATYNPATPSPPPK
jgi:hypothetical protein